MRTTYISLSRCVMEAKQGLFKSVLLAVKSLGKDYNSEEKELEKQVEEIEKVQKEIERKRKQLEKKLAVEKVETGSSSTKKRKQEVQTIEREER